jgi:hypothetical protein
MPKFRKKPVVVEANQWFRNGDHPDDHIRVIKASDGEEFPSEGRVVRYFRDPTIGGTIRCGECDRMMHDHGWIDQSIDGLVVCPGDWVITGVKNEMYPCKPDIFALTYEEAHDE